MSEVWISIRERKDRPGKWLVDVGRGAERSAKQFSSFEEAKEYSREVRRASEAGALQAAPECRTLGDLVTAFLKHKTTQGCSLETMKTYRFLLERAVLLKLPPETDARQINRGTVDAYVEARLAEVSVNTVRHELDRLKAVLDFGVKKGSLIKNPFDDFEFPEAKEAPKDWLRSNELGPFLSACTGDFAPIARFTIFTGLRRREVVYLQASDIDLDNLVVSVRNKPKFGFRTKSGEERSVPLDPTLLPLLRQVTAGKLPGAWVFPQRDGTRRSPTTRWFAVSSAESAERAGLNRSLTFHDLRRTFGAMLIESGLDIYEVSRLLGHADVRVTQKVYAPICGKFLAERASRLGRYLAPKLVASGLRNHSATSNQID